MSLIAFFIGLIILFKGGFHLAGRTISQAQSRSLAFYLMAPLVLEICASFIIVLNSPNLVQFGTDGTASVSADMFNYVADTMGTIELISVGIAVLLVLFTIFGTPKTISATTPAHPLQASPATPQQARVPDIMTVAEAAAYMRISEREVLGLIDQGKLGAARIGDSYRIARIAIEDFLTSQ